MPNTKTAIFLSDGLEECEALIVVDLLRRADIEIDMISISDKLEVLGSHNICIKADKLFKDTVFDDYVLLCLPGGLKGTENLSSHKGLCDLILDYYNNKKYLAAICAAPSIFAKLQILKNKNATCYPSFSDILVNNGAIYDDTHVVVCENIITSRGLGAAMDFAATLIEKLQSPKIKSEILNSICYK